MTSPFVEILVFHVECISHPPPSHSLRMYPRLRITDFDSNQFSADCARPEFTDKTSESCYVIAKISG